MSNSVTYDFLPWEAGVDLIATGRQLNKFRRLNHLSQEGLSEIICAGCDYSASKNAISTWETGKKLPSLSHVVFLAELWRCSIDELVISYRRSREAADRDQPVPSIYCIMLRRMYASLHIFVYFFWYTSGLCTAPNRAV